MMPGTKQVSAFLPAALVERARRNVAAGGWAAECAGAITERARPWLEMSDDDLWSLMFGPTLRRAWQVWSNGWCPACRGGVPMYNWIADPLTKPWKMTCPHCGEAFPKNDFKAFYDSGLDPHGIFDPARADRSLLFNAEHPDPSDPLHGFGVDDGGGYSDGEHRWWFIAAYLIYGQWKKAVVAGILNLADAHVLTGERAFAHKAAVLLDRVADLYPTFDFGPQGVMYEGPAHAGYVSTWHDACEETRQMVLAYDAIFEAAREDAGLVEFLSGKARRHALENPKASFEDIRRNIEDRILRDALASTAKIHSNYPRTEIACIVTKAVLGWPENRAEALADLDQVIETCTAVDGVTGEKGLPGYAAYVIWGVAQLLEEFERMEPGFLADMLRRHPRLRQTWRFHIDTWCGQQYYPSCGDAVSFAEPVEQYHGVAFGAGRHGGASLEPSMFSFLWHLYEATGDAAYAQALWRANDEAADGLPWDVFAPDAERVRREARVVIRREGSRIRLGSVHKAEWHLAILRSGAGRRERALWLDYDCGGRHSHSDALNLGLFALGLDLLPDFGYPPVQFGGWGAPRAVWYSKAAAHNTVVVDGKDQTWAPLAKDTSGLGGTVPLWADGRLVRAVRASAPASYEGALQYERTAFLVELSGDRFYVADVFRVVGGTDHAKFTHSHFGRVTTDGLTPAPAPDYGFDTQMRAFRSDPSPRPGWTADWAVEDRRGLLAPGADVHFRHTDLTSDAEASLCEAWVSFGGYNSDEETWIPRLMVRRRAAQAPLVSTFVAVMEPYEGSPAVVSVRRLPLSAPGGELMPDTCVALEIVLADGTRDLIVSADAENPTGLTPSLAAAGELRQNQWQVRLAGEACFVRRGPDGAVRHAAVFRGSSLSVGKVALSLPAGRDFIEASLGCEET